MACAPKIPTGTGRVGLGACGGAAPAGVTIRLQWSRDFRLVSGGYSVHRHVVGSSVVRAPTAFVSAVADADVFERSLSSGIGLNPTAIAGGSAMVATAVWSNLMTGVHAPSYDVSPLCEAGAAGAD